MFKCALGAVVLASAMIPSMTFADAASVARNCASGGDCVALVNAEIADMSGSPAARDKAIAGLVVAIGNEAQSVSPEARQSMANAVESAAQQVSDAEQRDRIIQVAAALRRRLDQQTAALDGDGADASGEKSEAAASAN